MAGSEETAAGGVKHERIFVVGGIEYELDKVRPVSFFKLLLVHHQSLRI